MNTTAVIAEFNPFHNGHKYIINQAKEITSSSHVVCAMSGNFLQRGYTALLDKYMRSRMALLGGVDVIFELPTIYSCQSAWYFASGAVNLIGKLNTIDTLCFGAECDDIGLLSSIADILNNEPDDLSISIKQYISEGKSYPKARELALNAYLKRDDLDQIVSEPNNILAIEYIRAIKHFKYNIKPIAVKRICAGYHDNDLTSSICSASAIRNSLLTDNNLDTLKDNLPDYTYDIMKAAYKNSMPMDNEDLYPLISYLLIRYNGIPDYIVGGNNDLSNRFANSFKNATSLDELCQKAKSKQYTMTRINRLLINMILDHNLDTLNNYMNDEVIYYAHLLGFRKESSSLIKELSLNSSIPIITKVADSKSTLNGLGLNMFMDDLKAADIYNNIVYNKFHTIIKDDYTHPLEII